MPAAVSVWAGGAAKSAVSPDGAEQPRQAPGHDSLLRDQGSSRERARGGMGRLRLQGLFGDAEGKKSRRTAFLEICDTPRCLSLASHPGGPSLSSPLASHCTRPAST